MTPSSTPETVTPELTIPETTVPALVQRNATEFGDLPALSLGERTYSWREVGEEIATIATGLHRLGVAKGDRVAIMMPSIPEHWLADQAAAHLGAIPTTIYGTMPTNQVAYIARHSGAKVVLLHGDAQIAVWGPVVAGHQETTHVVVVDEAATLPDDPRYMRWSDFLTNAAPVDAAWFEQTWKAVVPTDPVTLIYTSGTTGQPKGVLLTNANVIANAIARDASSPTPMHFRGVCYLPLAHIAERMVSVYMAVHSAGHVTFCPDPTQLVPTLIATRPTSFFGVPRIWEKLAGALRTIPNATLATLGLDEVVWACSAAAPLPADVQEFFREMGLPIVEAWGMTEVTGVATSTNSDDFRIGSVGFPIPGTELMLADDGEILVRGPIVASGYLQDDGSVSL